MHNSNKLPNSIWTWLTVLLMSLAIGGCATVELVGDYDEHIDKGVTQLQKDVETFLVKLESTAEIPGKKVENYDQHKTSYDDFKVAVSGLRIRADSMEHKSITVQMLDKISNTLAGLEDMHRGGLAKTEIKPIRGALNSQFTAILKFELAKKRGEKPTSEGEKK